MVPMDQPPTALDLLDRFVRDKSYDDEEFDWLALMTEKPSALSSGRAEADKSSSLPRKMVDIQ